MKKMDECKRTECFGNTMGGCRVLETTYEDDKCPFYKTKTQVRLEREHEKN